MAWDKAALLRAPTHTEIGATLGAFAPVRNHAQTNEQPPTGLRARTAQ